MRILTAGLLAAGLLATGPTRAEVTAFVPQGPAAAFLVRHVP